MRDGTTSERAGATGSRWLAVGVVALAAAMAGALVWARTHRPAPALPVLGEVPPFALTDHLGRPAPRDALAGKVWIANFVFTRCRVACPALTAKMKRLQGWSIGRWGRPGADLPVRLVSFTVDPEYDTPERLGEYARRWETDDRAWRFLTGSTSEVTKAVTEGLKVGFVPRGAGDAFDVVHGEKFVLVDGRFRIRGYFDADDEGIVRLEGAADALVGSAGP